MSEQTTTTCILVTGSAGAVGRAVCAELRRRGHFVRGLDLRTSPTADESITGSIQDAALVADAMDGMHRLVHLAAQPDDADFLTHVLPNNYIGLYHVMEAARAAALQRVVLASSMQTVGGLLRDGRTLRIDEGVLPGNHYALSKVLAEEMGRMYARLHGLSVLAVRLGWMPRDAQGVHYMRKHDGAKNFYISPGDAGRCFACCAEASLDGKPGTAGQPIGGRDDPGESDWTGRFGVIFGVGKVPGPPLMDMRPARELAGYEPQDAFPHGAPGEPDGPHA